MAALSSDLPSPIPELLKRLKAAQPSILAGGSQAHKDLFVARAPGRFDVMGGIADYTGSLVCELPVDLAAAVAVQRRDDHRVVIQTFNATGDGEELERAELSIDDFYGTASLLPVETLQKLFAGSRHWAAYFAGVFPVLAKHKKLTRRATGANIACYSTVPMGAGLASSAAITCATLWAMTAAYHLILEPMEIAVLAQKVEQQVAGGPCGVMDQVTAILGKKDHLLLLKCQPHEIEGYVPVPRGMMFAGISSGVKHSVAGGAGGYRRARVSAFMAQEIVGRMYQDLGVKKDPTGGYLANITTATYGKYFRAVLAEEISGKAFLDAYGRTGDRATSVDLNGTYHPRAAAEHHVLENERVHAFVAILQELQGIKDAGERKQLATRAGLLMLESHRSYSTNAHLGSKETDLLVKLVMQQGTERGLFGAKITGGGEGGTVAVMAEAGESTHTALEEIRAEYEKQTGRKAELVFGSSAGSADSGTLKIPLSGL